MVNYSGQILASDVGRRAETGIVLSGLIFVRPVRLVVTDVVSTSTARPSSGTGMRPANSVERGLGGGGGETAWRSNKSHGNRRRRTRSTPGGSRNRRTTVSA